MNCFGEDGLQHASDMVFDRAIAPPASLMGGCFQSGEGGLFSPPDLWIAFPLGRALAGAARTLIRTLGAAINAPRLPFRARIDFCPSNLSSLWVAAWLSSHDSRKKKT